MENENNKQTTENNLDTRTRQQKIEDFLLNPDKEIFNSLEDFNDSINYIKSLLGNLDLNDLEKIQGEDGKTPELGVDYLTDEDLDKIESFINDRIKSSFSLFPTPEQINSSIEKKVASEVAKIPRVKGEPGIPGKKGEDGSPDTAEQILEKLRSLPKNKRINVSDIRGLQAELNKLIEADQANYDEIIKIIESIRITIPAIEGGGMTSVNWGDIGGDLEDQVDLKAALDLKLENITDLISAGTNITITGTGTDGDPFVISAAGGASGDVVGPASAVDENIAVFNLTTGKIIKDGGKKIADLELIANKSTDVVTDGASDTKYPSVKAIKDYADSLVSGLLDYRGAFDASGNVFPSTGGSGVGGAVLKGDMWIISVAGTLGGEAVQIGDSVIANVDTPGQTASNWNILNSNIAYVPEDVANKKTSMTGNETSNIFYLTAKAIYDWAVGLFWSNTSTNTGTNKTLNDNSNYIDADALHLKVLYNLGTAATVGMPVYAITWNVGNSAVEVGRCDADNAANMPCIGLVEQAGSDGTIGSVRTGGILMNVNTSAWSEGTALYVSPTTGALTSTKPTGAGQLIQRIGTVVYQHVSAGQILVQGAGRTNDVPNTINMIASINEAKGSDIASASSIDIGAGTGNLIDITGTTTITALGTVQAGTRRVLRFTGILTLTHNATSLILPTGANITTQAGDVGVFISLGSGNWVCVSYQRKDGTALSAPYLPLAGGTMTGKTVSAGRTEVAKTYTPASGSQNVALDASVNNVHRVTGNASGTAITFTITGMTEDQPIIVSILQGSTPSTIAAWFATIRWAGGTAPTLTAVANKRDTFGFIRTGADTYDGFVIGQNC